MSATYASVREQIDEELARLVERAARWRKLRRLLAHSDALLDRAERANRDGKEHISSGLRTAIRRLEVEVLEDVAPGPVIPQRAVDRIFEVQDQLLLWICPEFHRVPEAPDEDEPESREASVRRRVERLLKDSWDGFAWSEAAAGLKVEDRALLSAVLEAMQGEGEIRADVGGDGRGRRYRRCEAAP